jgi:hypothetical protein
MVIRFFFFLLPYLFFIPVSDIFSLSLYINCFWSFKLWIRSILLSYLYRGVFFLLLLLYLYLCVCLWLLNKDTMQIRERLISKLIYSNSRLKTSMNIFSHSHRRKRKKNEALRSVVNFTLFVLYLYHQSYAVDMRRLEDGVSSSHFIRNEKKRSVT